MNKMNNVMIDLETLATTADAVIMSIGAVRFDMDSSIDTDAFYRSISIDSNTEHGRRIDESTLIWWMGQSSRAKAVFTEAKETLQTALMDLVDFIQEGDLVWSNGASFDIPMLEHAYKQLDLTVPWKFWNSRCMRTYKALPGAERATKPTPSHHALQDAIDQVRYLQEIHAAVFGRIKEGVAA